MPILNSGEVIILFVKFTPTLFLIYSNNKISLYFSGSFLSFKKNEIVGTKKEWASKGILITVVYLSSDKNRT